MQADANSAGALQTTNTKVSSRKVDLSQKTGVSKHQSSDKNSKA